MHEGRISKTEETKVPKLALGENGFIFGQPWHDRYEKKQILEFAAEQGFDGIELHQYYEPYKRGDESKIRKEYEDYGLEIPCIQTGGAGGRFSPISPREESREKFVEALSGLIEFAHGLGAKVAVLSPPMMLNPEVIMAGYTHEQMVGLYIDACSQLVETAEKNDVVMAIEPEPQMLLNGGFIRKPVEDVVELLDSIQSKYVAINYDTTHIYRLSKGDPVGYLKALKGRVGWTHLADNDGSATPYLLSSTHLVFGEGNVDMQGVMKTLKDTCGHLEWLDVDVWENPKPFETARENKRILESILERISWTNGK